MSKIITAGQNEPIFIVLWLFFIVWEIWKFIYIKEILWILADVKRHKTTENGVGPALFIIVADLIYLLWMLYAMGDHFAMGCSLWLIACTHLALIKRLRRYKILARRVVAALSTGILLIGIQNFVNS